MNEDKKYFHLLKLYRLNNIKGISSIKVLLFLFVTLALFLLATIGYIEGRKVYWDRRVDNMCQEDGGVKIYERATLPSKYITNEGIVRIPFESHATQEDEYYLRIIRTPIVSGYLSVGKHQTQVIRTKDMKILAEVVSYGRGGGDIPTFSHPSYHSCKTDNNPIDSMIQQVFVK